MTLNYTIHHIDGEENHLVDLARLQARIFQRLLAGLDGALDEIVDQRLQLGPAKLDVEMFRTGLIGGDKGQIDVGFHRLKSLIGRFVKRPTHLELHCLV